ncbi:MAG: helix-turn-helix domain-containing protein [Desulfobacteraceae bacterium]|nr:helix-turn-helix domain-containing protein [Desulfobacteraceae bacterium]
MSFGRYLKAIRKGREISLEQLAEKICVTPRQLTWIEAEDFDRMPAEIYAKGILRAYAEAVGVDPEDIVERYRLERAAWDKAVRLEGESLRSGSKNYFRMLLALAVLGVVIAASLYGTSILEGSADHAGKAERGGKPDEKTAQQHISPKETSHLMFSDQEAGEWKPESEMQVLSVDAVSETTLDIAVDGGNYTKYRLDPKDHLELAAQLSFRISISNPSAVRLKLNGKKVEIAAEKGKTATIVLSEKAESR